MILFKILKASITWPVPELVSLLGICSNNISLPDIKISINLKHSSLKQQMFFSTVYVTNVASLSGFLFFKVSHKDVFEVSVGAAMSPEGSTEARVTLKVMNIGLRLRSSLTISWRAPSVPCYIGLSNRMADYRMVAGFHQYKHAGESWRGQSRFKYPNLRSNSHHFWCILSIESKVIMSSPHSK